LIHPVSVTEGKMARADELIAQIEQLNKELEEAKLADRAAVVADVRKNCRLYGITFTELRSDLRGRKKPKAAGEAPKKRTRTKKAAAPTA
jgi:DNA-binding protein H-NS